MTRRAAAMMALGVAVVMAAMGLPRLRFDPDILGMLPPDTAEVIGLREFQQGFAKSDEVVVLIEGDASREGEMAELAASLAESLEGTGVAKRAHWRPRWMEGDGMAEWLAWLWLNGPSDSVAELSGALSPTRIDDTLKQSLAEVATALEGEELMMRANDPLGFLRHPALEPLMQDAGGAEGFESPDGRSHLVFVDAPRPVAGYRAAGAWLVELRAAIDEWRSHHEGVVAVHLTGEPTFAAEIGGAMENDMRGTVTITTALIALLFWWAQRRLVLLGGLLFTLGLVFLTAVGLAGWIYGELSVMAAAFAAILIGLAVDYGVLICQEAKVTGHDRKALWRATAGSILWAALTTAAVFFALNRSGLPGIAQLGTVVACGIIAGSALMLGYYLPFVAKTGAGRETRATSVPVPAPRTALAIAATLVIVCTASLCWRGLPGVVFDEAMLRPRGSPAMAAFDRVRELFPDWGGDTLRVVVVADDDATMQQRLAEATRRLDNHPAVSSFVLPALWWPDAERQAQNRDALSDIAGRAEEILAAADRAGFSTEGQALDRAVLEELGRFSRTEETTFPNSEGARELMRAFISRHEGGGGRIAGIVKTADGVGDYGALKPLNGDGIWLAGWDLLKPAVVPLVRRDITGVLLPMAGLMVVMLAAIFRSVKIVALCLAAMALGGLILLAAMAWLGIRWNFLNIAAAPLLLGTGIDYGIHVGLALRRNRGDVAAVWHGTGKAVVLCGLSTAIGFGSLCFASNEAMASLGIVAVIGILAGMAVSVLLLPPLLARQFSPR